MKQLKREVAALHEENKRLMITSAVKMRKQLDAERKLSRVLSHVRDALNLWERRVDDRTCGEIRRVRDKIEEIVNG